MKTFYNKQLLDQAGPNLVHTQFGKKVDIPAKGGKRVEWRRVKSFSKALTPLVEGVTPDGNTLTFENIDKEVDQYGSYTCVSDIAETTTIDDVILETTDKESEQAALTLDTITRNELVTGHQVIYAPNGTTAVTSRYGLTANCKLTPKLISKAATQLKKMNAPKIDGKYVCVVHPSVVFDIVNDENWIDVHKYSATKEIFAGEIGEYAGVRFVESTEAKIYFGADLATEARTLTVASYANSVITIDEALSTAEAAALIGRKIIVDGVQLNVTAAAAGAAAAATITVKTADVVGTNAPIDGDVVYPGEGGAAGCAAYACLFLGKEAYGTINLEKQNLQMIIHMKGTAGSADPLDQRNTIGWKATSAAKVLNENYMVRVECGSEFSGEDTEN